jgi:hypothetical protein
MNSNLEKDQIPEGGLWRRGRQYIFKVNKDSVECEDIFIAASLLCRGYKYVAGKLEREYDPATFAGTFWGKDKTNGWYVFVFRLMGNSTELFERKNLFHAGAHLVDPADLRKNRSRLMDALRDAKEKVETIEGVKFQSGGK